MSRKALSGFPEWTPSGRIVEHHVLDTARRIFELHGFAGIETRSVEPLEDLLRKGETSKEVYTLHRLQETDASVEAQLGLHFDLTVPFARYVLDNANELAFPFKRYQIQKSWRGERPQAGRFREFTQADIDVVGLDVLPFQFEVDIALVMAQVLEALPIGDFRIGINNRKVSQGIYEALGIADVEGTLRIIDKLAKIGPEGVTAELAGIGVDAGQADRALAAAAIRGETSDEIGEAVRALGVTSPQLEDDLAELARVLDAAARRAPGRVIADLSIARGLDYYTGTVYEATLVGHESFGAICAGGRYDSLVSDGKRTYPGVGLSLGISRLVAKIIADGEVRASRAVPSAVLVAVTDEDHREQSDDVAAALRSRGIPADVAPKADKFGKQIRYADRRGIPFVWFPESGEVKDIRSGDQMAADPGVWEPPAADWWPRVVDA